MPYVNVKITKDGPNNPSREQKARIIAEITATLVSVLGKKPEHTHIVIDEVDTDNWGFAGELTTEWRKRSGGSRPARKRATRGRR
jgi:4-oxalocrotonate tautomerase